MTPKSNFRYAAFYEPCPEHFEGIAERYDVTPPGERITYMLNLDSDPIWWHPFYIGYCKSVLDDDIVKDIQFSINNSTRQLNFIRKAAKDTTP